MEDPKITIGGREFSVPEFSGWANRKVSPALMRASELATKFGDDKAFGELIDTIFMCLTIQTVDGKKSGNLVNVITKDEFEELRWSSLEMATEVLPVLLEQAGIKPREPAVNGKGGTAANPQTPLNGETTSTNAPPISS